MQNRQQQIGAMIGALVIGLIASVLMAFPVKWLWNWLLPEIFGFKQISASQAWGLVFMLQLMLPKTSIKSDNNNNTK
jgi:hypothetical protein